MSERETMDFDVVIVGAGPAGLAAAIRLRQLSPALSVCVLEKGAEVGAHILSGAVLDPVALDELLPEWRDAGAPFDVPATEDRLYMLSEMGCRALPVTGSMKNAGKGWVVSLGNVCRWLADKAEALGVEIFPGFAGAEILYHDDGAVAGVATGDMGRGKDGEPGPNFAPGVALRGRVTLFAEGCRGHLTKQAIARFGLDADSEPQTYGLGIKELWDVDPARHRPGRVVHTVGWPLSDRAYGGGFVYHQAGGQVAVGLVVGLDYANPHLDPYQEFQRFKTHPAVRAVLEGGTRVAYGARTLSEGGLQSLPAPVMPGAALIGDAAGFLDMPRIKGTHTAMKSGMVAAEAVVEALEKGDGPVTPSTYPDKLRASWLWDELFRARNIRPAFSKGLWAGLAHAALDTFILRGRAPWTFGHGKTDAAKTLKAHQCAPIAYPKPDGVLTFDRASSVHLAGVAHDEDQPCHLKLSDPDAPAKVDWPDYGGIAARYCPAGVYEFLDDPDTGTKRMRINAANCVHCKTCDIKDPTGAITWTAPQGGEGPNYPNM